MFVANLDNVIPRSFESALMQAKVRDLKLELSNLPVVVVQHAIKSSH